MAPDKPTRPEQTDVVGPPRLLAGKYRIGKLIGEGGMGSVYLAEHTGLEAKVALKLLNETCIADPDSLARFRREAKAMAAVKHDNVVTVMDTGTDEDGVPFIVMEYLEGESLAAILRRNRTIAAASATRIATQILAGLSAAHAGGVVHRDLKPANIFMARQPDGSVRAKILDFGVSKLLDAAQLSVTADGVAVGTPTYMAPEQVFGQLDVDARVDIYAVGVILYRMLSGRLPFVGGTSEELSQKIIDAEPKQLSEIKPEISEKLVRIVAKAMSPKAEDRYQDAEAFRLELAEAASANFVPGAGALKDILTAHTLPADAPTVAASPAAKRETQPPPTPRSKRAIIVALVVVAVLGLGGLVAKLTIFENSASAPSGPPLRLGITQFLPTQELEPRFAPLLAYLSKATGRPAELRIAPDADELRGWLADGEVELAALSSFPFVRTKREIPGLRLVATTVTRGGRTGYYGSILVRTDSGIESLAELEGRPFCFVRRGSTSGWLLPRRELRRAGLDPNTAFASIHYGQDHLGTLKLLAKKACDGAAVYTKLWHDADDHRLDAASFKSLVDFLMPHDGYVIPPSVSSEDAGVITRALLDLKENSALAREVLRELDQGGFVEANDSAYDSIRDAMDAEAASEE